MTVLVEGPRSWFMAAPAQLLGESEHDLAWAEKHVQHNPAIAWVLGRYVEADQANRNNQYWKHDDLVKSRATIQHAPMNLLHHPRQILGHIAATEFLYPTNEAAQEAGANPYIETLSVMYRYYFPAEYAMIQSAYASGSLALSMECTAESLTCIGDGGCGETFPYTGPAGGPNSMSYCGHLNSHESVQQFNNPHFLAEALIVPPEQPGWGGAEVTELSALVKEHQQEAEQVYAFVQSQMPSLSPSEWEATMLLVMQMAKKS